jgi:hypothetical protein
MLTFCVAVIAFVLALPWLLAAAYVFARVSRWLLVQALALVLIAFGLVGCGGAVSPGEPTVDASPDAGAVADNWCCVLRNERGERLNFMCGTAINLESVEARGYVCNLAQ